MNGVADCGRGTWYCCAASRNSSVYDPCRQEGSCTAGGAGVPVSSSVSPSASSKELVSSSGAGTLCASPATVSADCVEASCMESAGGRTVSRGAVSAGSVAGCIASVSRTIGLGASSLGGTKPEELSSSTPLTSGRLGAQGVVSVGRGGDFVPEERTSGACS